MAYPSLADHVQELLAELAYWQLDPTAEGWDSARREAAADGCRKEIEDAALMLRQNGF